MRALRVVLPLVAILGVLAWPAAAEPPRQSPISIRSALAVPTVLPPLRFRYPPGELRLEYVRRDAGSPAGCDHRDEEETVAGSVASGAELTVGAVGYQLAGVHWHTPAEHRLDGRRFPLEQHLVHRGPAGQLLVVAVYLEAGPANAALERIFAELPAECRPPRSVGNVELSRLLPARTESYRYQGSLTTSPYSEGVTWIVLAEPITATTAQLDRFRAIFPDGNARRPQPRNGRMIETDLPWWA